MVVMAVVKRATVTNWKQNVEKNDTNVHLIGEFFRNMFYAFMPANRSRNIIYVISLFLKRQRNTSS